MSKFQLFSQLKKYLKEFLNDVYPGAKRSPIDYVKMMAMPDIDPDTAIEGIIYFDLPYVTFNLNVFRNGISMKKAIMYFLFAPTASSIINVHENNKCKNVDRADLVSGNSTASGTKGIYL